MIAGGSSIATTHNESIAIDEKIRFFRPLVGRDIE
jgi:hypothetical protein